MNRKKCILVRCCARHLRQAVRAEVREKMKALLLMMSRWRESGRARGGEVHIAPIADFTAYFC